ncbi:hypothetical protein [Burkholderia guangdongensis]|uniref:hypothetical protein n=1 Tax=Burkholderia guangdongensis TaxID=1792500 RepID=UPI0015CE2ED2|nr:hypothetical protein [Burkholderia guangdongensis]
MTPKKRIIVLGGRGETGRRIVEGLARRYPEIDVAGGSRRAPVGSEGAGTRPCIQIDIADRTRALATLSRYDLAILALGPMHLHGSLPHQICLEAGIDCIDINDNLTVADHVLALHDTAVEKRCRVFTGMGFTPGLSSLLLAELASRRLSAAGHYRIRACMGAAYGGGETSPYAILSSFRKHIDTLRDGRRQRIATPWKDGRERFQFPGQAAPVETIPFSPVETASLNARRSMLAGAVSSLDARYHIQYLKPGFARLMARFEPSPRTLDRFARKFYTSGQKMKRRKDADPDTVLWVYPDDAPERGLLIHGVTSSYDLTAAMACAVADAWLAGDLAGHGGVFAVDHLDAQVRARLGSHLARRGITSKPANLAALSGQGLDFGWIAPVSGSDVSALRHYRCNWYTAAPTHPKMAPLQKRFLLRSDVWKAVRSRRKGVAFLGFVVLAMRRWRQHYKALEPFRVRAEGPFAARWPAITRDISLFTSGYARVRDMLGQADALRLYGKMFLETGRMEMRWLWPDPTVFAALDRPASAVRDYWMAFMDGCQELGVLRFNASEEGNTVRCHLDYCAYAAMFTLLGCPELATLVRRMEREALEYMASHSGLSVEWRAEPCGGATIALQLPRAADDHQAERHRTELA